jgi:hypothetical protein
MVDMAAELWDVCSARADAGINIEKTTAASVFLSMDFVSHIVSLPLQMLDCDFTSLAECSIKDSYSCASSKDVNRRG